MSKNTRNRILLTALAALLLVTLTIGGTMAWLQDTSGVVTNTFTPSNIDVELTETQPGTNGGNAQMIPGATIDKDPKVTVTNPDTDAWVIIKVEASANLGNFISYRLTTDWTAVPDHTGYYYTTVAKATTTQPSTTIDILTSSQVTVLETVEKEDFTAEGYTNPTLSFTAYVVQKDTNIDTIAEAWDALFPTTGN